MYRYISDPERKRIMVKDAFGEELGEIVYFPHENENYWSITHTYINSDYRGKSLAQNLVRELVNLARQQGVTLHPVCPYARRALEGNPDYADVLYPSIK